MKLRSVRTRSLYEFGTWRETTRSVSANANAGPRAASSGSLGCRARVARTAHDAAFHCEGDRLRPATGAEPGKRLRDVPVHGALADAESRRDLFRGLPTGDVFEDLDFSPRERRTDGCLPRFLRYK
jgi:hypothetical protein